MRTRGDMLADGFQQAGIPAERFTKRVREGRYEEKVDNFTVRLGSGKAIEVSNLYAYGKWVGWTVVLMGADNFIERVLVRKAKRVVEVMSAVATEISQEVTA